MSLKISTIVGARPQFIKAAAVSRAIAQESALEEQIIHTGQHYDANMSDIFFEELGIPAPAHHLGFGGGSHGAMTGRMLEALEGIFMQERPDMVLIYGDTNSTLAGALAAAKLHIPIAHVEAGLRSFNKHMPEEINRIVSDHVSDLLLCPTRTSVENLRNEGITKGVSLVGDVMFDATLHAIKEARQRSTIRSALSLDDQAYALCTLHRAENTDDPSRFNRILDFLESQAAELKVVFPVHPRTKKMMEKIGRQPKGVILIDPVGYVDLHSLLDGAELILTDSGGLQKEAYFHRKPAITLRDETEWVELVEAGWNRLWTSADYASPRRDIRDYGAGNAGRIVVEALKLHLT